MARRRSSRVFLDTSRKSATVTRTATAWELIGLVEAGERVRVAGGRTLYEQAIFYEGTRQRQVKLARLVVEEDGLRQVNRYVDPDTVLEVVSDVEGSA